MKVTHPLSASSTQTYVGAWYLRRNDAIWELPTARHVTGMLNEHGMKDAKPVVTPAVNRNDDDDEDEEASAEEHRILRRIVGKTQFLAPRRPDIAFATNRLARSLEKPSKSDIIASKRLLRYLQGTQDFGLEAASAKQSVFNSDSVHRQRIGLEIDRRRKSVEFLISAGARTQSVIAQSSCEAEYIAATAATSEAKIHPGSVFGFWTTREHSSAFRQLLVPLEWQAEEVCNHSVIWTCDFCGCKQRPPARTFESARCLVRRTWLTLTPNRQTNVRWSSVDRRWASQRSRNSFVMQSCDKCTTVFLSLCHRS